MFKELIFDQIIDLVTEPIITVDDMGRILFANQAFCQFNSLILEDIQGLNHKKIFQFANMPIDTKISQIVELANGHSAKLFPLKVNSEIFAGYGLIFAELSVDNNIKSKSSPLISDDLSEYIRDYIHVMQYNLDVVNTANKHLYNKEYFNNAIQVTNKFNKFIDNIDHSNILLRQDKESIDFFDIKLSDLLCLFTVITNTSNYNLTNIPTELSINPPVLEHALYCLQLFILDTLQISDNPNNIVWDIKSVDPLVILELSITVRPESTYIANNTLDHMDKWHEIQVIQKLLHLTKCELTWIITGNNILYNIKVN